MGGFAGSDCLFLEATNDKADVTGIGDTVIKNLDIGTVAGLIQTTSGPIIGIFHQYAYHGKGHTIHAPNQFRAFNLDVNEVPLKSPCGRGLQRITTPEGYIIPLKIKNGLPYMGMECPNDQEMENYPHVVFTSDMSWDPNLFDDDDDVPIEVTDPVPPTDGRVNQYGEFLGREHREAYGQAVTCHTPNLDVMRPYFGWTPLDRIQRTLDVTTQYAHADTRLPMKTF